MAGIKIFTRSLKSGHTREKLNICSRKFIQNKFIIISDLSNKSEKVTLSSKRDDLETQILKYVWKSKPIEEQCFIEIIFKNNLRIEFYFSSFQKIYMITWKGNLKTQSKDIIYSNEFNKINTMILMFYYKEVFIKISNGSHVNTTVKSISDHIQDVNVGFCSEKNLSPKPIDEFVIRYHSDQFIKKKIDGTKWDNLTTIFIFVSVAILSAILFIISRILIKLFKTGNKSYIERPLSNLYDNQFPDQRNLHLINRNSNPYDNGY